MVRQRGADYNLLVPGRGLRVPEGGRCESDGLESGQAGDQHDEPLAPRRQCSERGPADRDLMGKRPSFSLKGVIKRTTDVF